MLGACDFGRGQAVGWLANRVVRLRFRCHAPRTGCERGLVPDACDFGLRPGGWLEAPPPGSRVVRLVLLCHRPRQRCVRGLGFPTPATSVRGQAVG